LFFKKTPFVLPQTKVKSCRAYVFPSSIFSINKNCRFCHDIYFLCYLFYFVVFFGKMVIQKTQEEYGSLFPFKNKFQKSAFTYLTKITHKSYAD